MSCRQFTARDNGRLCRLQWGVRFPSVGVQASCSLEASPGPSTRAASNCAAAGLCRWLVLGVSLAVTLCAVSVFASPSASLEQKLRRFDGHRGRLLTRLQQEGNRVRQLKLRPSGVGRDFQLRLALQQMRRLSDRLSYLQEQQRAISTKLRQVYQAQLVATLDVDRKRRLRRRILQLSKRPTQVATRVPGPLKVTADDTADDIEEKADLVADSHARVTRRLRRVSMYIARLERRRRLSRHAMAADDGPFVETVPRRTSRTRQVSASSTAADDRVIPAAGETHRGAQPVSGNASSGRGNGFSSPPAAELDSAGQPSAQDTSGGKQSPEPAAPSVGASSLRASAQDVLDPALLRRVARLGAAHGPQAQLRALRRAKLELAKLAKELSTREKKLRRQANRRKKPSKDQ